ncbi:hypothetical protein scyTo_0006693 [Scyliorhinus torazame]|uniref:Uncharacterized protein n=1 Tax=Scyliorhinus torazame TaxID=75743 RepID=A0A401PJG3_SCYTO|nr:hypothetical protein [Scyliorhinus torazame]
MLFNRDVKTTLPALHFTDPDHSQVPGKLCHQRHTQKQHYDRHAKVLHQSAINDMIRLRHPSGGWSNMAMVLRQVSPRSYIVKSDDGMLLQRIQRDLLKVPPHQPVFPTLDLQDAIMRHPGTPAVGAQLDVKTSVSMPTQEVYPNQTCIQPSEIVNMGLIQSLLSVLYLCIKLTVCSIVVTALQLKKK